MQGASRAAPAKKRKLVVDEDSDAGEEQPAVEDLVEDDSDNDSNRNVRRPQLAVGALQAAAKPCRCLHLAEWSPPQPLAHDALEGHAHAERHTVCDCKLLG